MCDGRFALRGEHGNITRDESAERGSESSDLSKSINNVHDVFFNNEPGITESPFNTFDHEA